MKNDMQFTGKNGEFQIRHMVEKTQLNFPVANEEGIKSSVTQTFGGEPFSVGTGEHRKSAQ